MIKVYIVAKEKKKNKSLGRKRKRIITKKEKESPEKMVKRN